MMFKITANKSESNQQFTMYIKMSLIMSMESLWSSHARLTSIRKLESLDDATFKSKKHEAKQSSKKKKRVGQINQQNKQSEAMYIWFSPMCMRCSIFI